MELVNPQLWLRLKQLVALAFAPRCLRQYASQEIDRLCDCCSRGCGICELLEHRRVMDSSDVSRRHHLHASRHQFAAVFLTLIA
jgi:hypothetical protein